MKSRHYKQLKEPEFRQMKAMLSAGISVAQVAKVLGRSYFTVMYVNKNNTIQEYKKMVTDRFHDRQDAKRLAAKIADSMSATATLGEIEHRTNGTLPQILTTLQEMNATLQKLEKLWEYKPKSHWFSQKI